MNADEKSGADLELYSAGLKCYGALCALLVGDVSLSPYETGMAIEARDRYIAAHEARYPPKPQEDA